MTATATTAEEFDPLDDPQVAKFYNRLKKERGQVAAERYLLTVTPTSGMTATTPTVVNTNRGAKEHPAKAAPLLTDPLPTSRSLAGSDALTNAVLRPEEGTTRVVPAADPCTATATVPTPTADSQETGDVTSSTSVSTSETPKTTVSTATAAVVESPTNPVNRAGKRQRNPARSTATVKQAFEDALATFIESGQPFKRSHVLAKAGLGASFYYTYPSLRTKVEAAIADMTKSSQTKAPSQATTMSKQANQTASTTIAATASTLPVVNTYGSPVTAVESLTATDSETQAETTTALTSTQRPVAGLAWTEIEGLANHWRNEQAQLKQQISSLLADLDTAVENAEAYERVLQLHTPQTKGESHGLTVRVADNAIARLS